ncbi:Ig-like domain repeat protein [Vibrio splendidus]|nr:Ig-like domain repeat protein [Vibrio splendidus]
MVSGDYTLENGVVTVTDLDLSSEGFADGTLTVTMTVTDKAGNEGDVQDTIALDLTAPGEGGNDANNSIEFVDGNDLLSEDELKAVDLTGNVETDGTLDSIVISGKDANGDDVSYTLVSGDYTLENGVVTVTDLDLSSEGFADGTLTVTMTVTDKAGNEGDVQDTIALDLTAPGEGGNDANNSIEFVDGNDLLSEDELKAVDLTGNVETDGTLDSIVISGKDANGDDVSYTLVSGDYTLENGVVTVTDLDLSSEGFADGTLTVTMTVTDKAGNEGDVQDTIALDLTAPGEGGNDANNSIEFVDGNDLLSEDELKAVDLTGNVETDGTLDSIVISGKDANGDDVSYTLVSGDYTLENGVVTVTDLDLSSEGFADGTLTVTMTVTDKAGNEGDVQDTIALDLTAPGEGGNDANNSIEFVDGNDLLSEDELKAVDLTGNVETDGTLDSIVISGKDANGDDVSYTLVSGDYTLENGVVTVTDLDLSSEGFADGTLTVTMTVTDKAGNEGDVQDTIALDLTAPGEGGNDANNSIEFVDGNDLLSEDELKAVDLTGNVETDGTLDSIVISGKDANGDDVSYTLVSGDYTLENGVVTVTDLDLSSEGFADGTLTVTMTVTDKAGNEGDVQDTIALDLTAPGEGGNDANNSIEFVDGNDLLSEDELKAVDLTGNVETDGTLDSIVISGKDANGDDVSYTLVSGDYTLENGVVTVTDLDLSSEGFADGTLTVTMTVTDKAGNEGDVQDTIALDLTAPGEGGNDANNSIEFVDGNDLLSEDELKAVDLTGNVETDGTLDSIVISGKDANGDDVSYTLVSGDYTLENGVVTVTDLDLSSEGFADGTLTVTMTVTDKAGNEGDVQDTIALDLTAPGEGGNDANNSIEFVDGNDLLSEDELKAVDLTGNVETDGTLDSIVISGKDANGDDVSYTLVSGDYT